MGMQLEDALAQRIEALARRLDQQELLIVAANFVLPAISRRHAGQTIHARSQTLFDQGRGDSFTDGVVGASAQYDQDGHDDLARVIAQA
jgi:hypothetical protein